MFASRKLHGRCYSPRTQNEPESPRLSSVEPTVSLGTPLLHTIPLYIVTCTPCAAHTRTDDSRAYSAHTHLKIDSGHNGCVTPSRIQSPASHNIAQFGEQVVADKPDLSDALD